MLRYFFYKVICICQNGSVAGRQPPGEDVGEGCSVPATYQNGRSSISNILGNSWGLPIHVLRVVCIFSLLWGRRFAPPSWLRLDCRHCILFWFCLQLSISKNTGGEICPRRAQCSVHLRWNCVTVEQHKLWRCVSGLSTYNNTNNVTLPSLPGLSLCSLLIM